MSKKNPPAFARPMSQFDDGSFEESYTGMTLRDYFAARALQGLLASNTHFDADELASQAYLHADAMLKERTHTP